MQHDATFELIVVECVALSSDGATFDDGLVRRSHDTPITKISSVFLLFFVRCS